MVKILRSCIASYPRHRQVLCLSQCAVKLWVRWGEASLFLPMEREEGMLFLLLRAKVFEAGAGAQQMQQLACQAPTHYAAAAELIETLAGLPLWGIERRDRV
jgi:hypothetical protein